MKTEWVNDFAEDLITATIWDHVPHEWGKWDSYQKWNYLNKRHMTILDCNGGASFCRAMHTTREDLKTWYNDLSKKALELDDGGDAADDELNCFIEKVKIRFEQRYKDILARFYEESTR